MRYNHFGMLPERAFLKVGGRITLEGGGDGGGGGNTTQTTYQTNIPDYLRGPTEQMVARATTLSEQPYQPYTGERIAGFSPAQQQAFADIAGLGTPSQYGAAAQSVTGAQQAATLGALNALSYTPGSISSQQIAPLPAITAQNIAAPSAITSRDVTGTGYTAQGVAAAPDITGTSYQAVRAANAPSVVGTGYQALGAEAAPDIVGTSYQAAPGVQGTSYTAQAAQYAGGWTPEEAQRYMSPYQQAVTDITKREATTEAMRLNQEMASKAAKAGVFGGSRFGVEQALLGKSLAINLADIQAKGQQEAYTQGLAQFNTEQGMRQSINLANQQAYNQALQFGATQEQAAAIANQAAENQARQFGASQAQAAAVSNQQVRQQANLASQAAYNQALQFGASQDQAAQIANQAAAQQVNLANQGAANQALQFGASQAQNAAAANQQIKMQANLASQQAYNQALQFGASQAQAAQIANQQASLTAAQLTQQGQLQAATANQAANLQAAQLNQQGYIQTSMANQAAALQAAQMQEAARQAAAGIQLQGLTLGANTGLQAAATLGTLGTQQQAADLQRLAAQQSAGAQQQALEQQRLDAAYQQAIEQRDWEKNQLGFLSGTIRGTPFSTSSTTSAPGATTASQLASLGLGAYGLSSLLGKKEGGAIKGYAKGGKIEGYAPGGNIAVADMYPDQVLQAVVAGKSDVVPLADAQRELHRRKLLRTAAAGEDATQTLANSRSLADQAEEAGVAALPADNMGGFADGGIIGYSAGGLPAGYDPDVYEMYEDPTSGELYPRKKRGALQMYGESLRAKAQGLPAPAETPVTAPVVTAPTPAAAPATGNRVVQDTVKQAVRAQKPAPATAAAPVGPVPEDYITMIRNRMQETDKSNAALAAEIAKGQEDVNAIRGDIKGIAALRAAAAMAQGGPGGTWGQVGRGLGVGAEEAMRGENLMQSARQGLMGQRLQMAQLERAANAGDVTALAQLEQLRQQGPLLAAQAKYYSARAADTGAGGVGNDLATLKAYQKALQDDIKGLALPTSAADKSRLADKRAELERIEKLLQSRIKGLGTGDSALAPAPGSIAGSYQRP